MHAYALEHLEPFIRPGSHVLDVGSGSGYLTACMAEMVGPKGVVVGIEHVPELTEQATRNMEKHHKSWMEEGRVKLVTGDGRKGWLEDAPYDAM